MRIHSRSFQIEEYTRAIPESTRRHIAILYRENFLGLRIIDDVIVFGKDEQSHFQNVETNFHMLEKANMKVKLDKCEFFRREVEFLGFIISQTGIKTNPAKVKAIQEFLCSKTLKDLRSFRGLSSYYRRFIRD